MEDNISVQSEEEILCMKIYNNIKQKAEENNFDLTSNAMKIAKVKLKFFGLSEWQRCPCDRDNNLRFCCSDKCKFDIEETGTCHCNCYKKK